MKQTAVEWLIEGLDKIYHIKEKFLPSDWEFLEETSKKIEKEQMIDFARNIIIDATCSVEGYVTTEKDIEHYYNETFNTNDK
jgi:hypothetical protein